MTDLQKQLQAAGVPDKLRRQVAGLEEAAVRDPLTGLYNRRCFDESLAQNIETARRYGRDLSLVLFDLDHFKQLNDVHGHPAGDGALKCFAQLLRESARKADIVCRIGGDEFAAILPETGETGAHAFAQRVMESLQGLSASFGAASLPADLFTAADRALLNAKKKKNQSPL